MKKIPLETMGKQKKRMSLVGLTLLEIMISMVMLAIIMTGMVNLFLASKRYILHNRSRMAGAQIGRYFLDPLQMEIREDSWGSASTCLGSNGVTGCPASQSIDGITYSPAYAIYDVGEGTNLRRVQVNITWNEPTP